MLITMKFGGTSLASAEKVANAADIIIEQLDAGNQVVAVVSAQGDTTDHLVEKGRQVAAQPEPRENDVLLAAGEQISMALLAIMLNKRGYPACSLCGWQAGIFTDDHHGDAGILQVDAARIHKELERGKTVIVAGFQGVDEYGDITTIGRGGSDTSAVAVAAALKADLCRIYTDVEGVFSADPRIIPSAICHEQISYQTMEAMAALGAKVLHPRAVELAKEHAVPLQVCSSFVRKAGTSVTADSRMERYISGIVSDRPICVVTITGLREGEQVVEMFCRMQEARIQTDVILLSQGDQVCFSAPFEERFKIHTALEDLSELYERASVSGRMIKLSLVGRNLRDPLAAAARAAGLLRSQGIDVPYITSGDRMISLIVDNEDAADSIRVLHQELLDT